MPDESTNEGNEPEGAIQAVDANWRSAAIHAGAGFGLAFAVLLASDLGFGVGLAAAAGAGLLLGRRLPGNALLVGTGVMAALLLYGSIGGHLAAGPGYEWQAVDQMLDSIATIVILAAMLVAYLLAALGRRARPATDRPNAILAAAGLVVGIGAGVTLLALLVSPASRSFELPASTGWTAVPRAATPERAYLLSAGRVAVYLPDDQGAADQGGPVVIVGVLGAMGTTYGCPAVFDPWPGSPLLEGTVDESESVALAAGPATRIHSTLKPDGSDAYLYFFRRSRMVGLAQEDLCYLLAIVGAPAVTLDSQLPATLAAAFRFR